METKYSYFDVMFSDIVNYIAERGIKVVGPDAVDFDELYDDLFVSDAVTGNASGSYTFSTWKAAECVRHNEDLLQAALDEFGYKEVPIEQVCDPEWCDVTIRCYLLGEVLTAVWNSIVEDVEDFTWLIIWRNEL